MTVSAAAPERLRRLLCVVALVLPALAAAQLPAPRGAARADPQQAELLDLVNSVRRAGCAAHPAAAGVLQFNDALSQAARLLAQGEPLEPALRQAHYKANRSVMLVLQGYDRQSALSAVLGGSYCGHVLNPELQELGAFRQGGTLWLVLAAPFAPPPADQADAVARQVLHLVNAARGQPRRCGAQHFGATGALRLNPLLSAAALNHARDMAHNGFFDHTGSDGSTPAQRLGRTTYPWRAVGENIASGQNTPADAVEGWIKSPGHCANLMAPGYLEMGLAYAVNRDSRQGIYWVQVFAAAR